MVKEWESLLFRLWIASSGAFGRGTSPCKIIERILVIRPQMLDFLCCAIQRAYLILWPLIMFMKLKVARSASTILQWGNSKHEITRYHLSWYLEINRQKWSWLTWKYNWIVTMHNRRGTMATVTKNPSDPNMAFSRSIDPFHQRRSVTSHAIQFLSLACSLDSINVNFKSGMQTLRIGHHRNLFVMRTAMLYYNHK